MATATSSSAPYQSVAAEFRAWGTAFAALMTSLGYSLTSDTGQINWSTVATPAAADTSQGYEIYKFTDALSASYPVYFKLEFGSATNAASCPAMWLTVGTGTDGAGTITGTLFPRTIVETAYNNSSNAITRATGSTNRLMVFQWVEVVYANLGFMFSLERTHDSTGADTTEGVIVFTWCNVSPYKYSKKCLFSGSTVNYGNWNVATPPSGTGASGADVYLYGVRTWSPGETEASINLFAYFNVDLTRRNSTPVTPWWGGSANIWPLGTLSIGTVISASVMVAIRWD